MQNTNPGQQNTPITEIMLGILASLLVITGGVLLYLKAIDLSGAFALWGLAGGLFGLNLAYKAPSPIQAAQLSAQTQNVQQIASQALAVLPMFANLLHSHAPVNVAPPPQGQVPTMTSMAGTAGMVRQLVQQPPVVQQVPVQQPAPQAQAPQQFKPPVFTSLPDISMPMAAMPQQQPPAQAQQQ